MEEIVKHINDTNASWRALNAGDAKNTDLFLDNEHYELFKDLGEQITVRFHKENLQKSILFIASILPRKYDNSTTHKTIGFSSSFVFDQLAFLDAFFTLDGVKIETRTQIWNARKDVQKKNGDIDNRFYFNGLLEDVTYKNINGELRIGKFTIRNYVAGGFSDIHIKKNTDGIFDVLVTNTQTPYNDGKDKSHEKIDNEKFLLQQIYYGAPGTGKSHTIKEVTDAQPKENVFRTTFHPDSDYSTFVGCYKPTTVEVPMRDVTGKIIKENGNDVTENRIVYNFIPQAFIKAYLRAWQTEAPVFLIIEEINRGNCAQIFGDLFQLLDRGDDGRSCYPIDADTDLRQYLENKLGTESEGIKNGKLCLPANLHIWATMNTSDQSLFPIDSAFKRRWEWKYIPIDTKKENWSIKVGETLYDWSDFLEKINAKIETATSSEDKMLGFYFCKAENGIVSAERFVNKVAFYLWNDVFKDYGFDDAIFNDENDEKITFRKFYKSEGSVDESIVNLFLENLKVESNELYLPNKEELRQL